MSCKKISLYCLALLVFCLFPVWNANADVLLTVTTTGSNVFVLHGKDLDGIAALDFQFGYDQTVMTNPTGSRGGLIPGDAIFNFNPSAPGEIRLFIRIGATAVNGSGTIATISFDGMGDSAGNIRSLNASLVTVKATPAASRVQILSQPLSSVASEKTDASTSVRATSGTIAGAIGETVTGAGGGTTAEATAAAAGYVARVSVPMTVERSEPDTKLRDNFEASPVAPDPPDPPSDDLEAIAPVSHPEPAESPVSRPVQPFKSTVYQSVLERMKAFTGERTPEALTALFNPVQGQKVSQEPPVAISDGESVVTLRVELPQTLNDTPTFSSRNATLLSLELADDGSWLISLIPKKNTLDVLMTVSFDQGMIVCPLVVSPPIDTGLLSLADSPEATFALFLKQQGSAREPRFDLNGDGRHDYLDDYIFTAQYLAVRQKAARQMPAESRQQSTQ